jgi:heat shock protein HslJ
VTLRRSLALLTLATLALVACADEDGGSGSTGTDPGDLVGHGWTLDRASMAALVDEVPAGAAVTIAFEDGQASGRAACNSYGGAYDAGDDGSLSFEGFAVTEMACDPELMSLESAYLEALGSVTGFRIDGTLTLHGGGVDLTFDEEVPPVALPLVGTTWTLTTIASGDAVSTALNGTEVTAEFSADGTVSGSAGCNRYSGSYTWTGDRLSFSALASTKMACADDVMAQEGAFLTSMAEVASFAIEGSQLTLSDGSGALLLGFDGTAA